MAKNEAKTVTVRQVRSAWKRGENTKANLRGLGLGRIGKEKTLADTPAVRGMIAKVEHLIVVTG